MQKAKRKGLSIRGIAREVGIHRQTVKKYMNAESPPAQRQNRPSLIAWESTQRTFSLDT